MPIRDPLLQVGAIFFVLFAGGLLAQRLRQALAPTYILAGLLVRPLVGDPELIEILSTLGVVLLMFMIGLEFSLENLVRRGRSIAASGFVDLAVNLPLGCALGWLLGFGPIGALVWGGIFYPTSSAIVCKSIIDLRRTANAETEHVLSVLVFEDLVVALWLALLAGLVASGTLGWGAAGAALAKAVLLCVALLAAAVYGRSMLERLLSPRTAELGLLVVFSFIIVVASVSAELGLSHALGGLLAGLMVSATRLRSEVEPMVSPFQQLLAAVFFVSFGLSIRFEGGVGEIARLGPAALLLVAASVAGKLLVGWGIGAGCGLSGRARFRMGLTLAPRGEFSVVMAGMAAMLPAGGGDIPPLAALFLVLSAVAGGWLMRDADRIHAWVQGKFTLTPPGGRV